MTSSRALGACLLLVIVGCGGEEAGNSAVDPACQGYLDCLVSTSPSAYAGALALYGENAACWDTPEQAANCRTACVAALADLGDECATPNGTINAGSYQVAFTAPPLSCASTYEAAGPASLSTTTTGFTFDLVIHASSTTSGDNTLTTHGEATRSGAGGTVLWTFEELGNTQVEASYTVIATDHFEIALSGQCERTATFIKL